LQEKHTIEDLREMTGQILHSMKGDYKKRRMSDDDITLIVLRRLA